MTWGNQITTALGLGISAWIIAGSVWVMVRRVKLGQVPFGQSLALMKSTPRAYYGLLLAHMGLGFVVGAITGVTSWQQENILSMKLGQTTEVGGYKITLKDVAQVPGPNYDAERGTFLVTYHENPVTAMTAERRFYPLQRVQTNQTGIRTNLISNIYIALGDADTSGGWTVRLYYHPLAPWLWIGGFTMALGGFVSLSDRRLRVGVPKLSRRKATNSMVAATVNSA